MSEKKQLKRLKFECHKCHKNFEWTIDMTGQPQLSKECPFCGTRCITIDPDPYHSAVTEILRGHPINLETETLQLPNIIPTTKPNNDTDKEA